jgi:hypothetical protein
MKTINDHILVMSVYSNGHVHGISNYHSYGNGKGNGNGDMNWKTPNKVPRIHRKFYFFSA